MSYFVIQVVTRGEVKYLQLAEKALNTGGLEEKGRLLLPRRNLETRKHGNVKENLLPLYPGYLFYRSDGVQPDVYRTLRRIPGYCRFLKYGDRPEPLSGEDEKTLIHFLSFGEVVESSRVYFDENDRVRVVSGPMSGLEGRIVKVNKRKKRAKIRLSLYEDSFSVDFPFEIIEQAVEKK